MEYFLKELSCRFSFNQVLFVFLHWATYGWDDIDLDILSFVSHSRLSVQVVELREQYRNARSALRDTRTLKQKLNADLKLRMTQLDEARAKQQPPESQDIEDDSPEEEETKM